MAEILPLKAWRYHERFKDDLEQLTSPLFDVVSPKQRQALYENPFNSIHLSVPLGDNPPKSAKNKLDLWKKEGVIVQDTIPGIYVYYQYFKWPGQEEESCRKGFIAQIRAYDWDEGVVLRHENTIAGSVNDRIALLKETQIQTSPTHGLYEDPLYELEQYMDAAILDPISDIEDYQGVREVLAVIHDAPTIRKFVEVLRNKQVILADGHHRYESAIAFRKEMMEKHPKQNGMESFHYHLMYFTNALSKDLRVLPTHRVFRGTKMDRDAILNKASEWFAIKKLGDVDETEELILQKQWAFGLVFSDEAYKIRLKPEKFSESNQEFPDMVRSLDTFVLHEFFIEKVLGIPFEEQRYSELIQYERNLRNCISNVEKGKSDFAVITKGISMKQVLDVCKSGYMIPQKSTYFYPKALSGLIFASLIPEEFEFPYEMFTQ